MEIWGHRGSYDYAPENTLKSFEIAAEQGANGVEFDVQLTSDGVLVVCHDENTGRTSDKSVMIREFPFEFLRTLNFNKRGIAKPKFMQIPTLQEILELLKPTNLKINIELKTSVFPYHGIEEKTVDAVNYYGLNDRVIYSSFNHNSVFRVKSVCPEAKVGLLHGGIQLAPEFVKDVEYLHPYIGDLRLIPDYIERAHNHGMKVNVWTVNSQEDMKMCRDLGADAIITNNIPFSKEILN